MNRLYHFFIFGFLYSLTLTASLGTVLKPVFTDNPEKSTKHFNRELTKNHEAFQKALREHPVYGPSQASNSPLLDFILFLTSYSHDPETAAALDSLLKTGGPFGFAGHRGDDPQAETLIAAAAQAIAQLYPDLAETTYDSSAPDHTDEVMRLQKLAVAGGAVEHPYHPHLVIPPSARHKLGLPNEDQSERWQSFLDFLKNSEVSRVQFAATTLPPVTLLPDPTKSPQKLDWMNPVLLVGFMMGVLPVPIGYRFLYLDDIWQWNNAALERGHNWVQWLFPLDTVGLGDRIAPRLANETLTILRRYPGILPAIQEMLFVSFSRICQFMGCVYTGRALAKMTPTPDKLLGSPLYGQTWEENWIISKHNYQRWDRVLRCLHFFGLEQAKETFFKYLQRITSQNPQNARMQDSLRRFWSQARLGNPPILPP